MIPNMIILIIIVVVVIVVVGCLALLSHQNYRDIIANKCLMDDRRLNGPILGNIINLLLNREYAMDHGLHLCKNISCDWVSYMRTQSSTNYLKVPAAHKKLPRLWDNPRLVRRYQLTKVTTLRLPQKMKNTGSRQCVELQKFTAHFHEAIISIYLHLIISKNDISKYCGQLG